MGHDSSSNGFEYLDNLIHGNAKEIDLNFDIVLDEEDESRYSDGIRLDVDGLVIDGGNHVIDADSKTRIFYITGDNIVLKNIVFKNAYSKKSGGAIFNYKNKLTLMNCKFINNVSFEGDGGAINNFAGFVTVGECEFTSNSSKNDGGAICNGNSMEILNCNFSNNNSQKNGFSIFNKNESSLVLKNSSFKRDDNSILQENYLNNEIFNMGIINIENSEKKIFKNLITYGFLHIISDNVKSSKHLKNLINKGKSVNLDFDVEFSDDEGIVIDSDDLVIDGNGHTIDALAKGSILIVDSKNITLKNINFRNANSKHGGLLIKDGSSLDLINCNFENNISENGGAINNYGTVSICNCNFENNFSKMDFGGAINNSGELTLARSNFNNNISRNQGGAINNSSHVDLEECSFKSNIAEQGGAINNGVSGLMKVIDCHFEKNVAYRQGSIIFNDNYLILKRSDFSDNHSHENCHGIYHNGDEDSELSIENCSFSHNLSDNNFIYLEEGFSIIYSCEFDVNDDFYCIHNRNADLRIERCKFINSNRKAIFNEGILNIRRDEKIENQIKLGNTSHALNYVGEKVPDGWKGFTYLDKLIHADSNHIALDSDIVMHFSEQDFYERGIEVNVDGLVIDGNGHTIDASNYSRIFIISAKNVVLKNIRFANGKYFKSKFDSENEGGGAIYAMPDSSVEISTCIFLENKSRESAGAILNRSKSFKLDTIRFENNYSRNRGGCILNENSSVEMTACDFINNHSGCSGVIYNESSKLRISNAIFNNNSADKCGAFFNHGSFVEFSSCRFMNNHSGDCAGVILNYRNSCEFSDCDFIKNDALGQGGAIFNKSGEITMNNCNFSENSSKEDGGCIFNYEGLFKVVDCNFNENHASNSGGCAENILDSKLHFINCKVSKNSARNGGAISNLRRCELTLKNCDFEDNGALENGGVVYNWHGMIDVVSSNFIHNESKHAGAIDNHLGWLNIKKSSFKDNSVKKHGGAIFNGGMLESLEDSIFENNRSLLKGGAIFTTKSSSGNILKSEFNSNRADGNGGLGGAIYNNSLFNGNEDCSLDLNQCNFVNNYANDDGAAIFNKGRLNFNECNFKTNPNNSWCQTVKHEGNNAVVSMKNNNFDD